MVLALTSILVCWIPGVISGGHFFDIKEEPDCQMQCLCGSPFDEKCSPGCAGWSRSFLIATRFVCFSKHSVWSLTLSCRH